MALSENSVKRYRAYFYSTITGDIGKLIKAAEDGEEKYNEQQAKLKAEEKSIQPATSTMNPNSVMFLIGNPAPPRCTIPLVMTCLSTMELMGALLCGGYNSNFMERIKCSLDYGGFSQDHQTRDALRGLFRNGFMHSFLPKGELIGVKYDSSYANINSLFITEGSHIILNANYLSSITLAIVSKLFNDGSIIQNISSNLEEMLTNQSIETAPLAEALIGKTHQM